MRAWQWIGVCCVGLFGSLGSILRADEFCVYTTVYDERGVAGEQAGGERTEPVARSLTMFHAGKAYDYLQSQSEFTIYEPMQKRFLLINRSRMLSTQIPFEEINTHLYRSRREAENFLSRVLPGDDQTLQNKQQATRFQLQPRFEESFTPAGNRLRLQGTSLAYDVVCFKPDSTQAQEAFLHYADWMARLNFVLHSQSLYPEPRMALNKSLRQRGLLPIEVRLQSQVGAGTKLRAVHQYQWKLETQQRRMILECDSLLRNPALKEVPLDEFQQRLTSAASRPTRR